MTLPDRVRGRVFGHGVVVGVRYGDRINDVDRERTVGAIAAGSLTVSGMGSVVAVTPGWFPRR